MRHGLIHDGVNSRSEHFISSIGPHAANQSMPRVELQNFADQVMKEMQETGSRIQQKCCDEIKDVGVQLCRQLRKEIRGALSHSPKDGVSTKCSSRRTLDGMEEAVEEQSDSDEISQFGSRLELPHALQYAQTAEAVKKSKGQESWDIVRNVDSTASSTITEAQFNVHMNSSDKTRMEHPFQPNHNVNSEAEGSDRMHSVLPGDSYCRGAMWQERTDMERTSTSPETGECASRRLADQNAWVAEDCSNLEARHSGINADHRKSMVSHASTPQYSHRLTLACEKARASRLKVRKRCFEMTASEVLSSHAFNNLIGSIIMMNALTIGLQTDHMAQNATEDLPLTFVVIEQLFLIAFAAELCLRVYVHRLQFLFRPVKQMNSTILWNWFDSLVVLPQLTEEALNIAAKSADVDMKNFRLMRVLRILRLMRVLRVMRVLRLISELRTIVSSLAGSMNALFWAIMLLLLMIYIVGVFFTQQITQARIEQSSGQKSDDLITLSKYFGSLGRSILSLYQAISGGLDWDSLADPLVSTVGPFVALAFSAYIAFAVLALLNVVTGVFVQTALQSAKDQEDRFLSEQIVSLFSNREEDSPTGASKAITLDEVDEVLTNPRTQKEWKAIDVKPAEAKYLFTLLDTHQNGSVEFEEFLSGCLRLHGTAKSIDMLTVMQELRGFSNSVSTQVTIIADRIDRLEFLMEESSTRSVGKLELLLDKFVSKLAHDVDPVMNPSQVEVLKKESMALLG